MPEEKLNVCIFGSRGFLGQHLTKFLKNQVDVNVVDLGGLGVTDQLLRDFFTENQIDVVLNAAGISDFKSCEADPNLTFEVNCRGVLNILNWLSIKSPATRFVNFGSIKELESESWYSATKKISREIVSYYRFQRGLWTNQIYLPQIVGSGQNSEKFVIAKIIAKIRKIKKGEENKNSPKLKLGNINSEVKLLYVDNAVELIWKAARSKSPEDYLLHGIKTTVGEFLKLAFLKAGYPNWEDFVEIDEELFRASSYNTLNYFDLVGLTLKKHDTLENIVDKLLK